MSRPAPATSTAVFELLYRKPGTLGHGRNQRTAVQGLSPEVHQSSSSHPKIQTCLRRVSPEGCLPPLAKELLSNVPSPEEDQSSSSHPRYNVLKTTLNLKYSLPGVWSILITSRWRCLFGKAAWHGGVFAGALNTEPPHPSHSNNRPQLCLVLGQSYPRKRTLL